MFWKIFKKKKTDSDAGAKGAIQPKTVKDTGHAWDGIKELENPIPFVWIIIFFTTIVFGIFYWIIAPSWPTLAGYFPGVSEYVHPKDNLALKINNADIKKLEELSFEEIAKSEDLTKLAMQIGKSNFEINCSNCHGIKGEGADYFPSLSDNDWIWKNDLDSISDTIRYGIRNTMDESRQGEMQAFLDPNLLNKDQVQLLARYVRSWSQEDVNIDRGAKAQAEKLFAENCKSCHAANGQGDREQGAPRLNDGIWLYGGSQQDVFNTIAYGRAGVMTPWVNQLSPAVIKSLSIYVKSLSED